MSNRRKTARERLMQAYRNAGKGPVIKTDGRGNAPRGEGRNNFAYGPIGTSTSVLTLHRHAARPRRSYATVPDFASMNRDQLRVAAKERGVEGWHKMNKAGLLAALGVAS